MKINTYPEMNEKIVEFLRIDDDNKVGMYAAARIEELEEQLKQAVGLLNELDAYFDFSEPIEQGDFIEFQDTSGINAVISKIREFISQETEVKP